MTKKLLFDTLKYARMLNKGGVVKAEIHSSALAAALSQNIYSKLEVDSMVDTAFNRLRQEIHELRVEMKTEIKEVENHMVRRMTVNMGAISAMLALVASIVHFIHI